MASALERAARAVREIDPELTICEAEEFARAVLMAVRGAKAEEYDSIKTAKYYDDELCEQAFLQEIDAILNEKDTTND